MNNVVHFAKYGDAIHRVIAAIEQVYVRYSQVENLLEEIDLLRTCGNEGGSAKCFFVVGPSGSSKSQTLKLFASHYPRHEVDDRDIIPVLYVAVPADASPAHVLDACLTALNDHFPRKRSLADLTDRLAFLLRQVHCELLIFDEVHHIYDRKAHRVAQQTSDWIKGFLNMCVCPVVLCGTLDVYKIIENAEQLARRSMGGVVMRPLSWALEFERLEFRRILAAFDEAMGFPVKSDLQSIELAEEIHYATDGLVGCVAQLLCAAAKFAIRSQSKGLTRAHLADGLDRIRQGTGDTRKNPFRTGVPGIEVTRRPASRKKQ